MIEKLNTLDSYKYDFNLWTKLMIVLLIFVISGVFGFVYETIFYRIDLGYFVKRGTTIGPWIPIYGFGGLFITFFAYKFRKNPFLVLLLSMVTCGFLEFITGYLLFNIGGTRLWDYNTEIWNFGNIGGYICLRSVLFFGVSGIFLISVVIPLCKFVAFKCPRIIFSFICLFFGIMFMFDFIFNSLIK